MGRMNRMGRNEGTPNGNCLILRKNIREKIKSKVKKERKKMRNIKINLKLIKYFYILF